jgi:hypothetical protein
MGNALIPQKTTLSGLTNALQAADRTAWDSGPNYCGPQAFASKHHFSRIAQFAERRS